MLQPLEREITLTIMCLMFVGGGGLKLNCSSEAGLFHPKKLGVTPVIGAAFQRMMSLRITDGCCVDI